MVQSDKGVVKPGKLLKTQSRTSGGSVLALVNSQVIAINTLRSIILVEISLNQRDLQCTVCIAAFSLY